MEKTCSNPPCEQKTANKYCSVACQRKHYYATHRAEFLAKRKAEYAANPAPIKAARAIYREQNRERLRLEARDKYATFPGRADYAKTYAKTYRTSNPEKVEAWRMAAREREKTTGVMKARRARDRAKKPWAILVGGAAHRAKKAMMSFDLTAEWAKTRWTGKCEVTDIPFVINSGKHGPTPYSPSIDRIDPAKGYVRSNCRFVLMAVNALKGCGTDEDLISVAKAITRGHKG